jgi:flagellar hook-length control protein FliK
MSQQSLRRFWSQTDNHPKIKKKGGEILDITQIGSAGSLKAADVKAGSTDALQASKKSMFGQYLTSQNSSKNANSGVDTSKSSTAASGSTKTDAYDRYQYKDNTLDRAQQTTISDKMQELSEETSQLTSDVVKVISDDLDVDEEAVLDAMETLGLTVLDLTDPKQLAALVGALTGATDDTQMLLNADFAQTLTDVSEIFDTFAKENGITASELSDLANELSKLTADGQEALEGENDAPVQDASSGEMKAVTEAQPKEQADAGTKVTVEDRRTPQEESGKADTAKNAEETAELRTDAKDNTKNDSSSSGKRESQDLSQHMAASVNEQYEAVSDVDGASEVPEYTSIDTQDIIDQIVEQTKLTFDTDSTTIEMQLNPENLGKIFLNISSKEGAVNAQLYAQNDAVRAALEAQIATLTQNLNQAGVKVDAIEVSVATHEFERNLEQDAKGEENQGEREEEKRSSRRSLRVDSLDEISGLMTEEEALVAQIMKDNGNSIDFTA